MYLTITVIIMTVAFFCPAYDCPTNQTAKLKPLTLVGLYKVVYVVKLLIGILPLSTRRFYLNDR